MPQDASGGTYLIAFVSSGFASTNPETRRDLAFQLCPSFIWDFASCLSCPRDALRKSLAELLLLVTATNHCRKIKNPASSAGRNHSHLSGSTRCSTSFYPVLVKNPTIGSTSRLRFSRAGRLLRSDCDAPEQSSAHKSPRTISNNTSFSGFVKPS